MRGPENIVDKRVLLASQYKQTERDSVQDLTLIDTPFMGTYKPSTGILTFVPFISRRRSLFHYPTTCQ
jgi:hypothetical protein